jgi:hypothetical protein
MFGEGKGSDSPSGTACRYAVYAERKSFVCVIVMVKAESELLLIVAALHSPRGCA